MDLIDAERQVADSVRDATSALPVGSGTHRELGGPVSAATEVGAPAGIVSYDPADLTITLGAGTTVAELAETLASAGQECPLDPRSSDATVGGTIAAGLSGPRRLRYGPLRDRVLEVRFAIASGALVRGGGPTVKNVTGYDMPRLLVGSLGTIGVLTRVILRCQPRPVHVQWLRATGDPDDIRRRCFRPSSAMWDGKHTWVLLEGHADDVTDQAKAAGLERVDRAPEWPSGPHRGRVSVTPARVVELGTALREIQDLRWIAESGVGTVHVAADSQQALADARAAAHACGGWLLREAGAPDLDGFGVELPNARLMRRVKEAFDPTFKLSPGRLPFHRDRDEAIAS